MPTASPTATNPDPLTGHTFDLASIGAGASVVVTLLVFADDRGTLVQARFRQCAAMVLVALSA